MADEQLKNLIKQMYGMMGAYFAATDNQDQNLGEWLDEWFLRYKVKQTKSRSSDQVKYTIDKYIRPVIGQLLLSELTTDNLQDFVNGIAAGNTRKKVGIYLNEALDKAVATDKMIKNPFSGVDVAGYQKKHYLPLEFYQQNAVLRGMTMPKQKAAFMVMCCTGPRIGEFLALDFAADVNYNKRELVINKAIDIKTGALNHYTKTKSGGRKVPFSKMLVPYLETLRDYQQGGGKFSYDMIKEYVKRRYQWCGIKGRNLHSLRHTFISVCYCCGIPVKLIQVMAGHSTIEMTMNVYTHILEKGTSPILKIVQDLADELSSNEWVKENRLL